MKKRVLSILMVILMMLPVFITAGGLFFAEKSENTSRYIVKFRSELSENTINSVLSEVESNALSESDSFLYSVRTDVTFFEKNKEIIEYYEPDAVRTVLKTVNDPVSIPSYDKLSVYSAWDIVTGTEDVIVAVLDTGVDRTHEDLKNVNILPGYDAVTKTSGVNTDSVGHGTGIIGLIAATANNGLGIAGIANGVTILPIRVSESGSDIFSSDLIAGIRYAADAGAKVINMSVGGYASSYAEQEAINYAVSKGCILVAAAGNGGELPYADQKCYPASYEGVVSVASCGKNGKKSAFSQYNDAVDVAAYGENVPLLSVEDGISSYKTDSGTSYSAAFVSGIAALTASHIGSSARFNSDEFMSLISETCGEKRTDSLGHGIINAEKILKRSEKPIISGVSNGKVYTDSVTVSFNRGTALLDGEPIEDGEVVVANGQHTLTVTDGEITQTVKFNLNYAPLYFDYREFPTYSYFEFERGNALLDGFPYKSKEKITAAGKHIFVIYDGDERREKEIYVQYTLPAVYGIKDGGKYNTPVEIRVVGDGRAELDGNAFYGETAVMTEGKHKLTVYSGNDAVKKEYSFEISFPYAKTVRSDYGSGIGAVDEENKFFAVYNDSLIGVAFYDITKPERYVHFLEIGRVYGHTFTETELLLFGDNGITHIDRQNALNPETAVKETFVYENAELYAYADGEIYIFANGNLLKKNPETEEFEIIFELGFKCEKALYNSNVFCLLAPSTDGKARFLNLETLTLSELDVSLSPESKNVLFAEGYIAVENRVYSISNGNLVLETASTNAVMIKDGLFFTENRIVDIKTAKEIGVFPSDIYNIVIGTEKVYIFGAEPFYTFIDKGPAGISVYGAAEKTANAFSPQEKVNEFRSNSFYDRYSPVMSSAYSGSYLHLLFKDKNSVYGLNINDNSEINPIPLKYIPSSLICTNGYLLVIFNSAEYIYIAPLNNTSGGKYIHIPSGCSSAFIKNDRLYFVSGGRMFSSAIDGSVIAPTEISAERIATDGNNIYVYNSGVLTAYTFSFEQVSRVNAEGETLITDSVVALGKNIYKPSTLELITSCDSNVLAVKGNTAVTENGVYNIKTNEYIGDCGVSSPESAVIIRNNDIIAFGKAIASFSFDGTGKELSASPEISGVAESGVYLGDTVITYKNGKGYLDGKEFKSGGKVSDLGTHEFILSLSCGRSVVYRFSVKAKISGIEFTSSSRTVSIGESVTLKVRFLPADAPTVPITFKCEGDGLKVYESGRIKALKDGKHKVTAEAVTDYGVFKAECTVTVVNTLISPKQDSGLTVDRDNGFLLGVAPDTTASALKSKIDTSEEIKILGRNGNENPNIVGTGTKVRLIKNGLLSDELTVIIVGDIDGDGYITAYDLYLIERILKNEERTPEELASADINQSGTLGNNDYRILKSRILGRSEAFLGAPPLNLFGNAYGQTVSKVRNGEFLDVIICLEGCKNAKSISGSLDYGTGLEFVTATRIGWISETYNSDGKLSFYAYREKGNEIKTAFSAVLALRFRVLANASESIKITSEGFDAVFSNRSQKLAFKPLDILVSEPIKDDFKIEVFNAHSFNFDPDVLKYKLTLPYNSALADINVTAPEGASYSVSSLTVPDGNSTTVLVTYTDPEAKTTVYTLDVKRDKEPRFDSNCHLAALEVEGHRLIPAFNQEILNYAISVPFGTEKITVYAVAENNTARVIIGDTTLTAEETRIPVSVGAPDGETLVYTITVTVLPDETNQNNGENQNDEVGLATKIAIIAGIIAVFIGVIIVIRKSDELPVTEENETIRQ